jgi:hypothetical protein
MNHVTDSTKPYQIMQGGNPTTTNQEPGNHRRIQRLPRLDATLQNELKYECANAETL